MKFDLSNSIDVKRAKSRLNYLIEKQVRISITKYISGRSLNQNSYLHVCIAFIARETGLNDHEAKHVLKESFAEKNEFAEYHKKGRRFLTSTADYTKDQMQLFIEFIRELAHDTLGCYIPTSEEYLEARFEIDRELDIR